MRIRTALWAILAISLVISVDAEARSKRRPKPQPADGPDPGPFARGKSRISIGGGTSGQFGNQYIVIGGGFGYYVANGLELGLDLQFFLGEEPQIYTVSPQVRYVFWQVDPIRPYVGAFFRHQFIDGQFEGVEVDDQSSVGGRAGIFYTTGRSYLGLGLAYEKLVDCDERQVESCEQYYPEFGFAFSL